MCISLQSIMIYFLGNIEYVLEILGTFKKITSKNELENYSSFSLNSVCGNSKTKKQEG